MKLLEKIKKRSQRKVVRRKRGKVITGSSARIFINGEEIGVFNGLYTISTTWGPIEVLGKYEPFQPIPVICEFSATIDEVVLNEHSSQSDGAPDAHHA